MAVELNSSFANWVKSHVHSACERTLHKLEKFWGKISLNTEVCSQLVNRLLVTSCMGIELDLEADFVVPDCLNHDLLHSLAGDL